MIPDQYPNYYKALEIYTGYFDSLDIMILFSYPSGIVITKDYCTYFSVDLFSLPGQQPYPACSDSVARTRTKPRSLHVKVDPPHNYSTQRLSSAELAKEALWQMLH